MVPHICVPDHAGTVYGAGFPIGDYTVRAATAATRPVFCGTSAIKLKNLYAYNDSIRPVTGDEESVPLAAGEAVEVVSIAVRAQIGYGQSTATGDVPSWNAADAIDHANEWTVKKTLLSFDVKPKVDVKRGLPLRDGKLFARVLRKTGPAKVSRGLQLQSLWIIPMDNPYCSCKLTRGCAKGELLGDVLLADLVADDPATANKAVAEAFHSDAARPGLVMATLPFAGFRCLLPPFTVVLL